MRVVIQRVKKAKVEIVESTLPDEKYNTKEISQGLVILVGITHTDTVEDAKYLAQKILNLRIFSDEKDRFDKSILDIAGEILVVSQFTLYGDCTKGRRPDFTYAAKADYAETIYENFISELKKSNLKIETGKFQAKMLVEIHNDGPVTIILDTKK